MAVARIFVNDFPRQLIKASVSREGSRAIDQAKFIVCPETPICVTDQVVYIQDMVNLDRNNLLFNFCFHVKDESGYQHHPIGHTDFPSAESHWDFQCTVIDIGRLQNAATEHPCDCMCVPIPSVFTSGKVMCNNDVNDRAILFECCRYLTVIDECEYDLRQDQRWSMSVWVYPTTGCDGMIMGKRAALACAEGYSLHRIGACANVQFEIGEMCAEFVVTSAACSVPLCMWTNVTTTFDGQSNRSGMKLYINGDLVSTGTSAAICGPVVNNDLFSIGATACTTDHFSGRVDGVYFFDVELSACEAASLFHEGGLDYVCGLWNGKAVEFDGDNGHLVVPDNAPADPQPDFLKLQLKFECDIVDSSCNNCCITMGTGCATFVGGLIDEAFCFDGCRYVSVPSNEQLSYDACTAFSWSTWAKIPACAPTSTLFGKKNSTGADAGWRLRITNIGCPNIGWDMANGTCAFIISCMTPPDIFDCRWHHLVGTYSGEPAQPNGGLKIYIDGLDTCTTTFTTPSGCFGNAIAFTEGALGDGSGAFTGLLDCTRVYKGKELTADEVLGLYEGTFGKFNTKYCIVTWVKSGSGDCDRTVFHKALSTTEGVELKIEQCLDTPSQGFTTSGYTASGFTLACCPGGLATWRHNNNPISSCSRIDDCVWHQVRVRRDACNLITMYVDNVLQAESVTDTTDPTSTANLEFARDTAGSQAFDGQLSSVRWYSGLLDSNETCVLFSCRNPRTNIKFGGDVTKSQKLIAKDELVAQSFGKELGDTEVRATQFCCRTPEFILQTLIKDNTNLDTHFHGTPAGITLVSYQADGKIVDIANDLSQLTGKVYHTDGLRQFHLHDSSFTITTAEFNHFINMRNWETGKDDAEIVNCLLIIGENKRFTTSCSFVQCCAGTQTTFDLAQSPVTARVFNPCCTCTELCPEECYDVNTATKKLIFTAAGLPAMCTGILIEYEYELPLNIQGKNQESIDDIGVKSKRLVLPWITTRQDGVRFINAYLENFKDVRFRTEAEIPGLANGINENDVVNIVNEIKGICGSFIIKSLTWEYPKSTTTIQLGEFNFQMLEFAKQITEKIHDLESAVVRVKDLRDYENPQELLAMIDTAVVVDSSLTSFTETLALVDVFCVTETFDAVYDAASCTTTYDGNDAYA